MGEISKVMMKVSKKALLSLSQVKGRKQRPAPPFTKVKSIELFGGFGYNSEPSVFVQEER